MFIKRVYYLYDTTFSLDIVLINYIYLLFYVLVYIVLLFQNVLSDLDFLKGLN